MSLLKALFSSSSSSLDRNKTCPRCGTTVRLNQQNGNSYWYGTCPKCGNKVQKPIPKK